VKARKKKIQKDFRERYTVDNLKERTMHRLVKNIFRLFIALVVFSCIGGAGGNRGILKHVQTPTESELRQDWEAYTVYHRHGLALIYKFKNDRKIILDNSWSEVSSEDAMAKSKIFAQTLVREIIGSNEAKFGYIVHRQPDRPNAKIIDEDTVQLFYIYVRTSGGP
jgi:hypothetical protein